MAFDYECLNLDVIGGKPIEEENLLHWQQSATLQRIAYKDWQEKGCKRVVVGNTVYELKQLYVKNGCLLCGKELNPQTADEQMDAGLFGTHLSCREKMSENDVQKFIDDFELEEEILTSEK